MQYELQQQKDQPSQKSLPVSQDPNQQLCDFPNQSHALSKARVP